MRHIFASEISVNRMEDDIKVQNTSKYLQPSTYYRLPQGERQRAAVPLHPEHLVLPGASHLSRLRPRHILPAHQRAGERGLEAAGMVFLARLLLSLANYRDY